MNENNEVFKEAITVEEKSITIEAQKQPNKCFGISALVFGILSLATFVFPLPLGSYFPLVGVIFAIVDKAKHGKMTKQGKAGFICSIVAYSIYVLAVLTVLAVAAIGFMYLPELIAELESILPPELVDMLYSL